MEKKKKNNASLIIVISALLLIVIGMVFFVYANRGGTKSNHNAKSSTKSDEINDLDIHGPFVESIFVKTQSEFNQCGYATQPLLLENVGDLLTKNNMSDDYKGLLAFDYVTKNKEISEDEMKKAFEEVFGENTYQAMNVINFDALGSINYDASSKKYTMTFDPNDSWGCVTHLYNKEKIITAYKFKDSIQITTAYVFNGDFSTELFKDAKSTEPLGVSMSISSEESKVLDYIDQHQDELHHLTYSFDKAENGNYYFSSVERTK